MDYAIAMYEHVLYHLNLSTISKIQINLDLFG